MISLDKLVEIGFTLAQATDISQFFRNVGYLTVGTSAVKEGVVIPTNKVLIIQDNDGLNATLKSDSQEYMDISKILVQKGNMNPNKGRVNSVVIYFGTLGEDENMGNLVDEFVSVNGNWSQLLINSNANADITAVAEKAVTNDRIFVAQTSSEDVANAVENNIAVALKELNNANTMLTYHTTAGESLAAGLVGIMANPNLGATGALYSTVTNVTPEDYTATVNVNLDNQNVTYYSNVNAINGGAVSQYASPIVMGAYMINGEDAKRRYIRFCLNFLLKARAIDFLKKKLGYEDVSADVLLSMLKSVLKAGQTNGLIKQDSIIKSGDNTINNVGFELRTIYPSELREIDESLYNAATYKVVGYYRDSLTGRKVEIDLLIDPSDADKSILGF
jgi:hypothetical protein